MQEAEEQDTCRICSAPAEDDQPLFHPCKCSGTIRYIHQDCLTTWLAHSKKKNCDVCKHPYTFTKVYASDMPSTLPLVLLIRRLIQQALFGILFGVRGIVVAVIWLAVLPWATVWTWRMYFSMGDSTAWWIANRTRPTTSEPNPFYHNISSDPSAPMPTTFIGKLTVHPVWIALSADIFTGQIIASLIVLTFVAIFLLREWISQNARPGVFEDEEVPEDPNPAQAQGAVLGPRPGGQAQQGVINPLDEALARRQIETLRALDALRARDGVNGHMVGDTRVHGRSPLERPRRKGKARQKIPEHLNQFDAELRAATRRRLLPESPEEEEEELDPEAERIKRKSFSRRVFTARLAGARRKAALAAIGGPPPLAVMQVDPKFEFTFKASSKLANAGKDNLRKPTRESDLPESEVVSSSAPIFPQVTLQPPRASIPFSFDHAKSLPSSPTPTDLVDDEPTVLARSSSSSSLNHTKARRPPLPTSTLPPLGSDPSSVTSLLRTPLDSPSLATYRAPEELEAEAGPSRLQTYFDEDKEDSSDASEEDDSEELDKEDFQAQVDKYFTQPPTDDLSDIPNPTTPSSGEETEDRNEDRVESPTRSDRGDAVDSDGLDSDDDSEYEEGDDEGQEEGDDEDEDEDADEDEDLEDLLFGGGGDWDVRGEEGEVPREAGRRVEIPEGAPPADQAVAGENQPPADDGIPPELNEEIEGNVEDDMEGAMEAIGMRGPIYGVLQNAALMIFVLDTAIGLGIWIPFTIGKSTALLSLDPPRFLQIIHLPIRAIRVLTDPIVDSVVFFIVELLYPPLKSVILKFATSIAKGTLLLIFKLLGQRTVDGIAQFTDKMESHISHFTNKPLEYIFLWPSSVPKSEIVTPSSPPLFAARFEEFVDKAEPYFALLGMKVRLTALKMQVAWTRMALGEGPGAKAFAILLGYAVASLFLALYLNLLTVGNAKSAGRAVRSAVRQQLLVLKVATFIFIELVTFPLSCGLVLDLCTVWLFPEANLASRVAFVVQAPLTAVFYHWVAGTMFMYAFAVLLSGCRSIMRAGAMWFIKDPQDQNSHPIRDILDRPTFTQLRKICVSGLMYSCVVACVVGSVAGLLLLGSKSIMPFRWKNREPLSNVPIDLLFLHLVLPYTMQYFRPKKAFKAFVTVIWKILAAKLRLTSYFFGGRYPSEEHTPRRWNLSLRATETLSDSDDILDGTFRRVPATDNLALPREMRATVEVTADGQPVGDAAKALMARQDAEVEKAKRHVKDEFMIVYIPPYFRYRIMCFIASIWVIGAVIFGIVVALPIQLGRSFFELFTTRIVHDGYALIAGFYILWGGYLIVASVDRLDKRRLRTTGDRSRADLPVLVIKRGAVWIAKATYMAICLGIIIPTLISFVIDLYIVLPIRFALDPDMTPRIRVVDTWALGLLYAKIALHATRVQRPNRITRGIQHITANGWTNPAPIQATKEMIGPVTGGLIGMIVFPGAVFRAMQYFLPHMPLDDRFIFMHVYPGIFMFAGLIRSAVVLYDMLSSWAQSIRDKEFLVEMRLRNHEPEKVNVVAGTPDTPPVKVEEIDGEAAVE